MTSEKENEENNSVQDYENNKVLARNRLMARSYFIPGDALLLNGKWDFHYAPNPLSSPHPTQRASRSGETSLDSSEEILTPAEEDDREASLWARARGQSSNEWSSIDVPGHWELQGHGKPHYTNVIYPFPVCPPFVPSENPTGTYRRRFRVPPLWDSSSQLRLRFDGVDSAYHVWVNGVQVGYAQGSRNPAEFDVSNPVKRDSENELFVKVYKWSDGSYIEDQDQWWLSGIFRDVHLLALPSVGRIEDFFIKTDLDSTYTDATIQLSLDLALQVSCVIEIHLRDKGAIVQSSRISLERKTEHTTVELPVENPNKWSAETPYLYEIQLDLFVSENTAVPLQTIKHKIGFRTVEIKNGNITVNGIPILLRGVNRHDHHPRFGRAVPLSYIRDDLLLMKRHNINALRCAHYPCHPQLYDLCDELGLWVMDEADLECHGFYDAVARPLDIPESMDYEQRKLLAFGKAAEFTSNNEEWKDAYVDRMVQLVQRDKNHPSIIIWSLGNEAFYGQNLKAMYDYVKSVDPGRPVHYEGDAGAISADMYSYMYPSVDRLIRLATADGQAFTKPIVLCEYAHSMGNAPGGLAEYMQAFREHRRLQGGFIWEWANHGLLVDTASGKEDGEKPSYAYGGDFNDTPNDGSFVMDGLCFSDHTPGPGLIELGKAYEPVRAWVSGDSLVMENGYDFISLDHLDAAFKIEAFSTEFKTLVATGRFDLPIISAGQQGTVNIPSAKTYQHAVGEIWLTVIIQTKYATEWADGGHEVTSFQYQLATNPNVIKSIAAGPEYKLEISSTSVSHNIHGPDFLFTISRTSGHLTRWHFKGHSLLETESATDAGISVGFWRPPTDNDIPWDMREWKRYGLGTMTSQLRRLQVHRLSDGNVQLSTTSWLSPPILGWGFIAITSYVFSGNGAVTVSVSMRPQGPSPKTIPRVGLDIKLPPALKKAVWFGRGPGESYVDKKLSQKIGVYKATTEQLHTPYEIPQENGNRVDTKWLKIGDERGWGIKATREADAPSTPSFQWAVSRYSPEVIEQAKHPRDLVSDSRITRLRLDAESAGVGTGACGPTTLEKYRVPCKDIEFAFKLEAWFSNDTF